MTEPLKEIYDPAYVKEQAQDLIAIIDPLLQEEIHRATQLLHDCELAIIEESGTNPRDEVIPAFYLFMHIIEIADGIRELLVEVCTDAAAPLLRTLLESMLSLRFIVVNVSKPEVAMAWYVGSLKARRKVFESMDPITSSRKKRVAKGIEGPPTLEEKRSSQEIKDQLARLTKKIDVDHKGISDKIKDKNWYTPYGGGANIEQLAANLRFKEQYPFYRQWSARIHAADTDFLMGSSEEGHPVLRGIRDPSKLRDYASLTSSMLLNCIITMVQGYCPKIEKEIRSWYENNARAGHVRLKDMEIVVTTTAPIKKP